MFLRVKEMKVGVCLTLGDGIRFDNPTASFADAWPMLGFWQRKSFALPKLRKNKTETNSMRVCFTSHEFALVTMTPLGYIH
jgi:hypothetical protein